MDIFIFASHVSESFFSSDKKNESDTWLVKMGHIVMFLYNYKQMLIGDIWIPIAYLHNMLLQLTVP